MKIYVFRIGLLLLTAVTSVLGQDTSKTILFVCEHGSAKSIIATAHFNRLAKAEGINVRAISRGINPDSTIPKAINDHLIADGLKRHIGDPIQLTDSDLNNSEYVIVFNPLPQKYNQSGNITHWNIPSFEAGYPVAKDSILTNIKRIIDKIKSDTKN